jgi:hypothetical protein
MNITGNTRMRGGYSMGLNDTSTYGTIFKNGTGYWTELSYNRSYTYYLGNDASVAYDKNCVAYGVRVVLELNSDVLTVGKNANGAWTIDL